MHDHVLTDRPYLASLAHVSDVLHAILIHINLYFGFAFNSIVLPGVILQIFFDFVFGSLFTVRMSSTFWLVGVFLNFVVIFFLICWMSSIFWFTVGNYFLCIFRHWSIDMSLLEKTCLSVHALSCCGFWVWIQILSFDIYSEGLCDLRELFPLFKKTNHVSLWLLRFLFVIIVIIYFF